MTDTPRRRPPLPTREGTLKIKPRAAAPADAPAAKPGRPGEAAKPRARPATARAPALRQAPAC